MQLIEGTRVEASIGINDLRFVNSDVIKWLPLEMKVSIKPVMDNCY